jgi:mitochondrial import receptor subunit TOM22
LCGALFNINCTHQHIMASTREIIAYSAGRLATSFGKALWLASTTVLVLVLPLVIEMDREQQLVDMEKDQMGVLTGKTSA